MPAPEDLDVFCREEYPRLVGMLDLYVGDVHVAQELAQEALFRASRRWERVGTLESPGGWTYRVAINLAKSRFRRLRAARRARRRLADQTDHVQFDPDGADRVAVREVVGGLPERQRTALVLRYYADLSVAEVAELMGTSRDAVRSLTKRAVATLRDELVEVQQPRAEEVG